MIFGFVSVRVGVELLQKNLAELEGQLAKEKKSRFHLSLITYP